MTPSTHSYGTKAPADASATNSHLPDTDSLRRLGWLMVIAIALHGPVDLILTAMHLHLESNPIVLAIGWPAWLTVKAVAIPAAALIWWELRREADTLFMAHLLAVALFVLSLVFIIPNLLMVVGVLS